MFRFELENPKIVFSPVSCCGWVFDSMLIRGYRGVLEPKEVRKYTKLYEKKLGQWKTVRCGWCGMVGECIRSECEGAKRSKREKEEEENRRRGEERERERKKNKMDGRASAWWCFPILRKKAKTSAVKMANVGTVLDLCE
jgi:hypothetical protein